MPSLHRVFSDDGAFAAAIDGFAPRQAQIDMAEAVGRAQQQKHPLIVEAGTGTGKTFAYLAPTLLADNKVIISTGTKNLQEQLYLRDLPLVKQALGVTRSTALLKGRANYLCLHRLSQHRNNSEILEKQTLSELTAVRKWASSTTTGDIGELNSLSEDARVFPLVTSTVDNCLGKDCPDYDDCYLLKARAKAMAADLVVVNHHLFFADMALKDTGFGELIPEADMIVFDEAHQLPEIASNYFGQALSGRQIQDLSRDIELLYRTELKDARQLHKVAEKCRMLVADLRLLFPEKPQRGNWVKELRREDVIVQIGKLKEALGNLYEVAKLHIGRNKEMDALFERISQARARLNLLTDVEQNAVVLWYETTPRHITLHLTPLSIADKFADFIAEKRRGWVFTSATLSVDGGFSHFQQQMGLRSAKTLSLDSPFDYQNQAMLCVPRYLPEPSAWEMKEALFNIACKLIEASKGRCFLLFTSHAMLRQLAKMLEQQTDYPILVQGSTSKRELLKQFVRDKEAVLLATGAFWEGVDVKGDDLRCVMIDKLPFASPDDPLLQARIDESKKSGNNAFASIQIPQAVIALKQGAGRLIRDSQDSGVLVICDNRLVNKDYAKAFLASLPPMQRSRDIQQALEFLEENA